MAKSSKTPKPDAMRPAAACIIRLPSALSTRVENIRVRGNYPAGVVSLARVRRHLLYLEIHALRNQPEQPKPAPSLVERTEDDLVYWQTQKELASRLVLVYRRALASACRDAGQELKPQFLAGGILHLVPAVAKVPARNAHRLAVAKTGA